MLNKRHRSSFPDHGNRYRTRFWLPQQRQLGTDGEDAAHRVPYSLAHRLTNCDFVEGVNILLNIPIGWFTLVNRWSLLVKIPKGFVRNCSSYKKKNKHSNKTLNCTEKQTPNTISLSLYIYHVSQKYCFCASVSRHLGARHARRTIHYQRWWHMNLWERDGPETFSPQILIQSNGRHSDGGYDG